MSDAPKTDRNLDVLEKFRTPPITEGLQELGEMPSIGWVVHEVARSTESQPLVWAWCKVSVDGPGYSEITFTAPDGITRVPYNHDPLVLGRFLFKLWC